MAHPAHLDTSCSFGPHPTLGRPGRLVACCLAAALTWVLPARAQRAADRCSELGDPSRIEVLDQPFRDTGDTCLGFHDTVSGFGDSCSVAGVTYGGQDAIYEVRLHAGNRVAFRLDVLPPADLVLVLLRTCGDGGGCETSSPDFIGSGDEEIPSRPYHPGVYYLYVDSATSDAIGRCGAYTLTVEGANPVPDLQVSLSASPRPVIAGTPLTYTLAVSNAGDLAATGVTASLRLPEGTTLERADPGCTRETARTVRCALGDLPVGASEEHRIRVRVSPSARGTLSARAEALAIEANESQSNRADALTDVEARTDLALTLSAADSVVAGEDLTYRVEVTNHGPSDSLGGRVVHELSPGLSFRSSASGCAGPGRRVVCPVGPLTFAGRRTLTFVARVAPSVVGTVSNRAAVVAEDPDPVPGNDGAGRVETAVRVEADLGLTVVAAPEPVVAGTELSYHLTVVNGGPSVSPGGRLVDTLPRQLGAATPPAGCTSTGRPRELGCPVPRLGPGHRFEVTLTGQVAPSAVSTIVNRARVEGIDDPDPTDDFLRTETATEVQADLHLAPHAPAEVFRGAGALYSFRVTNDGPSRFAGGTLRVDFDPPLTLVSSTNDCHTGMGPDTVSCAVSPVPPHSGRSLAFVARVPEDVETGAQAVATAALDSRGADPHPEMPATAASSILDRPDLVLPHFEVFGNPAEPAVLLAVENLSQDHALVRFDFFDAVGKPITFAEGVPLGARQVLTANLRDVGGLLAGAPRSAAGYLWITRTGSVDPDVANIEEAPGGEGEDLLTGDVLRVDPAGTRPTVSGGRLVSADPGREPAELCHLWSVPYSSTEPFTDTDFVFWLAAAPDGDMVSGRVYDDAGTSGQKVAIPTGDSSFSWALSDLEAVQDDGTLAPATLPTSGSIEWELPDGRAGNVSAVHRGDGFAIGVPGTCLDAKEQLPGTLALPYFELDAEPDTSFVARNEGGDEARVTFRYFTPAGDGPVFEEQCHLAPHAVRRARLLDLGNGSPADCDCRADGEAVACALPANLTSGYATIEGIEITEGPETMEVPAALSGSYFRIDQATGLGAGEALVAPDTTPMPSQLCHRWTTRLIDGGDFTTDFVFYAPDPDGTNESSFAGTAYDEDGTFESSFLDDHPEVAFQVNSQDLGTSVSFGSVEWTFPEDRPGHVSTLFRAPGGYSVLIPGVCLDPTPDP